MPTYYHNETLFSEIYLEEITRQTEHADVLASLKVLGEYREYGDTHNLHVWKDSYVHEVLSALGFYALSKGDHLTFLFPMGNSDSENPLSLCYVVLPDENLDNTTIGRNWAEKIIRALREKNLQWGVLTNGKQWRVYHQDEPTPYETYLEIDLEAILSDNAKEAYQIFHKFMKADNFVIQEDGKCQFDRFKKESQDKIDYIEKELANALKQREEGGKGVLSDLCMGYVEDLRRHKEGNLDEEGLRKKIYHGAMLYMFRLLFLLYADARQLLSDGNHALLEKVESECRARHDGGPYGDSSTPLWDNLEYIFVDFDQTYNGGLFSPQESEFTRFLSDTRIGDTYLANVIFNLITYREKNGQEKPISYRDMSVRHLGTLYEGLLEHKLFIAKEDTEVKVTKGKIQFIPVSQGGKRLVGHYVKSGEVYFAGDPSERKSTGSYYTPEYIVDYIVRNTVGEKLNELKNTFLKDQHPNLEAYANAIDEDERSALRKLLEENALAFVHKKILDLSVLDPAMGSGHFLVNATNLISNLITEILNGISIQGGLESGTGYWRRWVVEDCIYGVDINPLAVELTKLSLWILSMAIDQPLSFMNHHLKCGNSLTGARLDEIGIYPFSTTKKEPRQLKLFERDPDFRTAVGDALAKSHLIASRASASLADVEEKKAWLAEIDSDLEGYKAICNVHVGLYFRNQVDETEYSRLVENRDFARAIALERPNQYFHWELEFPEVFLNQDKGFDVVIGNPPWGRNSDHANFINLNLFKSIVDEDNSEFFIILGISLLKKAGIEGEVLPDTLLNPSKLKIRRHVISNFNLKVFDNIGPDWFSSDVRMSTILWICVNQNTVGKSYNIQNLVLSDELRRKCISGEVQLEHAIRKYSQEIPSSQVLIDKSALIKTFVGHKDIDILEKMRVRSVKLGDLTERGRGVELNKQGLVVKCAHCSKWNSPPKMDEDGSFGRKTCQFCNQPIIVTDQSENIKYLVQDEPNSIPVQQKRLYIDGDQIGRYGVRHYKYIDISAEGINYKSESLYSDPKLLLRQAGVGIKAIYDVRGSYCPQSIYVYKVISNYRKQGIDELVLLGILLSRIFHYFLFKEFGEIDSAKAFVKLTHSKIEGLPFPKSDSYRKNELDRLKYLVSELESTTLDNATFRNLDWEVEGIVSRLFGIDQDDIAQLVNEFSKVHENGTLLGLFPDGVRGREKEIEDTWSRWLLWQDHQ